MVGKEQNDQNTDNEDIETDEIVYDDVESDELRVKKTISKKDIISIKIKNPVTLQSLFLTRFQWEMRSTFFLCWYLLFFIIGVIIVIISISIHAHLNGLWNYSGNETDSYDDIGSGSVVLFCATVRPIDHGDIKEFIGIPYASLPIKSYHFYKPAPLLSFVDCYKAYWANLQSYQKKFENGRLTFNSSLPYIACKQISKNRQTVIGEDACLVLNIKSPVVQQTDGFFSRKTLNRTKLPVVIILTGRTYLGNRPFQVSDSIIRRSNSIFITINFRLGVLGFANFNSMKSPRNVAIIDFLKAMEFIYKYIGKFGGDKDNMTLLAEESGATTAIIYMIMKKEVKMFANIWLIDGSAFVPDPPARNLFYELYSSTEILCSLFSEPEDIFNCLQNLNTNQLLNNTPTGWLQADSYFHHLPSLFEERESIVEKEKDIIISPLEVITKPGSDIVDVPIVIMSKIDYMPYFEKEFAKKNAEKLTKSKYFTKIRLGLLTYQTVSSQVVLHKEINLAYNEYIKFVDNRSIFNQNINKENVPLGFEVVLDAIISDLRSLCPYTAVAKYLQVNAHIVKGPIYRIFDGGYRFGNQAKNLLLPCDLLYFLQDEFSECKSDNRHLPSEYKETLISSFINFVNRGKIDGILQMDYPMNASMKEFEDTFTFIGRLGFRTSGVREVGFLQACNIWKKGSDEFPMLKTSAKVN